MRLEGTESDDALAKEFSNKAELFANNVTVEFAGSLRASTLRCIQQGIRAAGGELHELRSPSSTTPLSPPRRSETRIIARTIRNGGEVEAEGSVIVLGDVNPGARIVSRQDIIVVGTLRGIAHAGVDGNPQAIIWADSIQAPQLRIDTILCEASEFHYVGEAKQQSADLAHLENDALIIRRMPKS